MQFTKLGITSGILVLLSEIAISPAGAEIQTSKTLNCARMELEAVIDGDASREENLERLTQQFFQSVNTIEHCDHTPRIDNSETSTSNGGSVAANSIGAAHDNGGDSASAKDSKGFTGSTDQLQAQAVSENNSISTINASASDSLIGTNFDQNLGEAPPGFSSDIAGTTSKPAAVNRNTMGSASNQAEQALILTNGKTPDDIPNADNDSVLEAQIRAAAIAEPDPDTQKNLWNEYRRYKGLPERE